MNEYISMNECETRDAAESYLHVLLFDLVPHECM